MVEFSIERMKKAVIIQVLSVCIAGMHRVLQ